MAKVIDTRNFGGQLVVLGDAIVMPSAPDANAVNIAGSIRYNPTLDRPEFIGKLGTWSHLASGETGSVVLFATTTPPTGWLLCDGSAVSRTTYAALFSVIGTAHGTGNGTTTFNLPLRTDADPLFAYFVKA